ncbi:sensor histidine kinase [Rhizobium sp. TRM95796]|uniref:sensor histidine kinase n=1 Tax=Rhizobium sp. TRM95796 TaxID=2979862 RepID=UPI0021E98060|nr:sensor histidine kinase [Rhizobium sp. TRM95796]MCV3765371.1 sensor histidine kinase [Rhizobium sp. TRM95796]
MRFANCLAGSLTALLIYASAAFAAETLTIDKQFTQLSIDHDMQFLIDPSHGLTPADLERPEIAARFRPAGGGLALGYRNDTIWVRILLDNRDLTSRKLFLELKPMVLNDVEVFTPNPGWTARNRDFASVMLGDHHPRRLRPVVATSHIVPLTAPVGASEILVRVRTSSSLAVTGWLRTAETMIQQAAFDAARFAAFEALLVFSGVANLLIWRGLRETLFLQYAVALLALAVNEFCYKGLLFEEWVVGGGVVVDAIGGASSSVCLGMASLFVRGQTRAAKHFPWLAKALLFSALLSVFTFFLTVIDLYQMIAPLVMVSAVIVFAAGFFGNAWLAFKREPGAGIATSAFGALLIGMMVVTLRLTALSTYTHWSDYAFEIAVLFFILYMQLSLARRTRQAESDHAVAQARALDVARAAEKTAVELVERRTAELRLAKEEAETALKAERDAQAEQVRFLDVISHQYRTPLAVVSSSVASIARGLSPDDVGNRQRIERIKRAIGRLVELIDVSLHRSRIDGASARPRFKRQDYARAMDALFSMLRDTFPDRRIRYERREAERDLEIVVDPDLLAMALANLVENALKFSPPGAPVDVDAEISGEMLSLRVTDWGIGVPEAERHLLTEKYFRASNSANTQGMGLGLHICATIARRHGGALTLSDHADGGAVALLDLPVVCRSDQDFARIRAASTAK